MNYFVSVENAPFHHWQIELIIESFILHNQQNQLLIALAQKFAPAYYEFCRNLSQHPRILGHENRGGFRNQFYSLHTVLIDKLISQPLAILQPDVVLYHPVEFEP